MAKDATALALTHAVAAEMKKNPAKFGGTAVYEVGDRRFLETQTPTGPKMVELWFTIPQAKNAAKIRAEQGPIVKSNVKSAAPTAAAKSTRTRPAKKIAAPVLEEAAV